MTLRQKAPDRRSRRLSTWPPARLRSALLAVATAATTSMSMVVLGSEELFGSAAYVVITLGSLFVPAAIVVQVTTGLMLLAGLLTAPTGPDLPVLVLLMAGVVGSAELLAEVARLDTPLAGDSTAAVSNAVVSALLGGGVFGVVTLLHDVTGPVGLLAVVVASGTMVVLAALLVDLTPRATDVDR